MVEDYAKIETLWWLQSTIFSVLVTVQWLLIRLATERGGDAMQTTDIRVMGPI